MILLRSGFYYLVLTLSVGVFGLIISLIGPFSRIDFSDRWGRRWGRFNLWAQRWICGLGYEVSGLEHLPDQGCIVMAKHQSAWETIAFRGILPPQQSWVLKQELMRLPLFGRGLRLVRSIPIDRSAGRRAVLKIAELGCERLAEGRYVIIFPEGTRTQPGQRQKYGLGGGMLAQRSGAPVIPIAHNAGVFWERRGVKKYPGTVQVRIGPPIASAGRKPVDIMRDVEDWIEARQDELPISRDQVK